MIPLLARHVRLRLSLHTFQVTWIVQALLCCIASKIREDEGTVAHNLTLFRMPQFQHMVCGPQVDLVAAEHS